MSAGACLGAGIAPNKLTHILGVYKSYQTRVGAGPMPTELDDETGNKMRRYPHHKATFEEAGSIAELAGKIGLAPEVLTGRSMTGSSHCGPWTTVWSRTSTRSI